MLTLNPDVLLLPNFIQALVEPGNRSRIGTVCGKLLTISRDFDLPDKPLVDSTGIYFTPMLRHLDRGSQEVDNGHYLNYEYVFGATAAAALYRREMIDDIAMTASSSTRLLRIPGRRRRGLASPIAGLAVHVHAHGARLSRAQGAAGKPARAAPGDQHALGEKPVPDAAEEHDPDLTGVTGFHHHAGPGGGRLLPAPRAQFAEGILVPGRELEAGASRSVARS